MAFLFPSYFPFCIYEGEGGVGDGTYYPVGMTLEDAMTLYWKAKSFRIVETWNTTQPDTGTFVTGSTDTILTPSGNLNTMTDVSCRPAIEANGRSGTFSITIPNASGDPGPFLFQDYIYLWLFQEVGVIKRNGLYYPQISLERDGGYYPYFQWFNAFNSQYGGPPVTLTINGNQYNFTLYGNSATTYNNCSINITINSERTAS
jgi:hypothetical protein